MKGKKIYNWGNPMEEVELLEWCVGAFNELPNKKLKHSHFPNTYAIASTIDATLRQIKERRETLQTVL